MNDLTGYTFDLAEGMVNQIEEEFGPESLTKQMAGAFDGTPDKAAAEKFFTDFGRRWMELSIELGEKNMDRTYEVLLATAEQIPEMRFPFIAQRYIEIAYLSAHPIYTVPITENGVQGIVFKMPFCGYYTAIQDALGDDFADELHCTAICDAACKRAFEFSGDEVAIDMESTMDEDGLCQFRIKKA